jgi:hypothetical protein
MLAEEPEIAELRHRRRGLVEHWQFVFFVAGGVREGDVDFAHLKAADLEVSVNIDFQDVTELECQRVEVPARLFTKPVQGEPQQSKLRFVEIAYDHRGNLGQSCFSCGKNQPPASDNAGLGVDDDWENKAELLDARLQLADLSGWVFAGLTAKRL